MAGFRFDRHFQKSISVVQRRISVDYCKSSMMLFRNGNSLGGQEAIDPGNPVWV
jgi:hypothetical protein